MRVLLIHPPSPDWRGTPLLGTQYLAASLLGNGIEVRVLDAGAPLFSLDDGKIAAEARKFRPDLIGVSLFTRRVARAYRLAAKLRGIAPLLVAGGPHATVCPEEPLAHGFDAVLTGEGEVALVRLVRAMERGETFDGIPGTVLRGPDGGIVRGPRPVPIRDLDSLPIPLTSQHLFDPAWYSAEAGETLPGGILTSRGCPARCVFCANQVTGRSFRFRSAAGVVEEIRAIHARTGNTFLPCWDDALTANAPRLFGLCDAIREDLGFPFRWSAITRATMVTPEMLGAMKRAGLVAVNFGIESGDDATLRMIRKGQTTAQVVRALEWAKAEGLMTVCNFMMGFPGETADALRRTLEFMRRIEPLTDCFSTGGVVIPMPGTELYENHHERYGFTRWWLEDDDTADSLTQIVPDPADDPNLARDFFRYDDGVRELIAECLDFKARHNHARFGSHRPASFAT